MKFCSANSLTYDFMKISSNLSMKFFVHKTIFHFQGIYQKKNGEQKHSGMTVPQ